MNRQENKGHHLAVHIEKTTITIQRPETFTDEEWLKYAALMRIMLKQFHEKVLNIPKEHQWDLELK